MCYCQQKQMASLFQVISHPVSTGGTVLIVYKVININIWSRNDWMQCHLIHNLLAFCNIGRWCPTIRKQVVQAFWWPAYGIFTLLQGLRTIQLLAFPTSQRSSLHDLSVCAQLAKPIRLAGLSLSLASCQVRQMPPAHLRPSSRWLDIHTWLVRHRMIFKSSVFLKPICHFM